MKTFIWNFFSTAYSFLYKDIGQNDVATLFLLLTDYFFISSAVQSNSMGRRGRLPTEPGPDVLAGYASPTLTSPIKSPPYNSAGTDSDDNSYKCKLS